MIGEDGILKELELAGFQYLGGPVCRNPDIYYPAGTNCNLKSAALISYLFLYDAFFFVIKKRVGENILFVSSPTICQLTCIFLTCSSLTLAH